MPQAPQIEIARVYDLLSTQEGERILVDRLWPRGVRKEDLRLDAWVKEVAPSSALRRWFNHRADRWAEFCERYSRELEGNAAVEELADRARRGPLLLLYSARDAEHNNAVALRDLLFKRLKKTP